MTYIKEVVFASIVCGIITKLPVTQEKGSGKFVKFLASLTFLFILLSPLTGKTAVYSQMYDDLKNIGTDNATSTDQGSVYESDLDVLSNEICKAAIKNAAEKFSVSEDTFSVKLVLSGSDYEDIELKQATVYVDNSTADIDKTELQDHFESILNIPVEVALNE